MRLTTGVLDGLLPLNFILALLSALNRPQTKPSLQISTFFPSRFSQEPAEITFCQRPGLHQGGSIGKGDKGSVWKQTGRKGHD